jgi:hypothetical protein
MTHDGRKCPEEITPEFSQPCFFLASRPDGIPAVAIRSDRQSAYHLQVFSQPFFFSCCRFDILHETDYAFLGKKVFPKNQEAAQ